jgi:biopolymer transport protein ExbD
MARQRKRPEGEQAELSMTPMIDVVFQLLIYFIVTIKPVDVITNLDVFRPAPDKSTPIDAPPPQLNKLGVYFNGYTINEMQVPLDNMKKLDDALRRIAAVDAGQTLMITVSSESEHGTLVRALDLCAKNGLRSLSVVSASN